MHWFKENLLIYQHEKVFLKTKEIRNLSDKSEQEQQKNLAMLPLPDVITKGLKENKNIVIDAYGTVLFADIVSFTVFFFL